MNPFDSVLSRKYKGHGTVGRAGKKTHMAVMETKMERINILNEKMMRVACVQGLSCFPEGIVLKDKENQAAIEELGFCNQE